MFGPLYFPNSKKTNSKFPLDDEVSDTPTPVYCLFCDDLYLFPCQYDAYFLHLFDNHKLVIADVHQIAKLPTYLEFWKCQFRGIDIKVHCSAITVDIVRDGVEMKNQEYYLLSDIDPTDKKLREDLQKQRLEEALTQQTFEREDKTFKQGCLYCSLEFETTRAEYLNHLSNKHNLILGRPQNLVYIDKLINTLREKMDNLQCIYCEKFFKDRHVLKEHMRKKQHKRINPTNKMYDKFFIINYLEMGKSWKGEKHKERRDSDGEAEDPSDWSDWQEMYEMSIVCLFCEETFPNWESVLLHMEAAHEFKYLEKTSEMSFYEQVKLVNYIRRQLYKGRCIVCNSEFETRTTLLNHMVEDKHITIPLRHLWDQPEFYFPTYENDAFLCQLDDDKEDELSDSVSNLKISSSSPAANELN